MKKKQGLFALMFLSVIGLVTGGMWLFKGDNIATDRKEYITGESIVLNVALKVGNDDYVEGTWTNSLNMVLSANAVVDKIQWNYNGEWLDLCTDTNICNSENVLMGLNLNSSNVKFRIIDDGYVYGTTRSYDIKVDSLMPTCSITKEDSYIGYNLTIRGNDNGSGVYGIKEEYSNYKLGNTLNYSVSNVRDYRFIVRDNAGNVGSCTFNWPGSETSPVSISITPNGGKYYVDYNNTKASFAIDFNVVGNVTSKLYGWSLSKNTEKDCTPSAPRRVYLGMLGVSMCTQWDL